MSLKKLILTICVTAMLSLSSLVYAENIDPYNDGSQYAYGENVGWLNFEPNQGPGVHVSSTDVQGYLWAENIGWINLSPAVYGGVTNDGSGNLGGYAWGENVGWINFDPAYGGGVTIDPVGNFAGWAWGENIGWIHLASSSPVAYKVQACVVTMDDLNNFASYWLEFSTTPADLNYMDGTNYADFAIFADYWQDFCPDGWGLK